MFKHFVIPAFEAYYNQSEPRFLESLEKFQIGNQVSPLIYVVGNFVAAAD
jgi:hypothetical protein